jgi:hypothetical protein
VLATGAAAAEHHADHTGDLGHAGGEIRETLFIEHPTILEDLRTTPALNTAPEGDRYSVTAG